MRCLLDKGVVIICSYDGESEVALFERLFAKGADA